MLKVALGTDVFVNYIENSNVYIDKSLFIRDLIDSTTVVSLITRPRRFGKTLNMTMLQAYFEKNKVDYASLFFNLKIWQCGEEYKKEQGKYPVIFLTLKEVKYSNWDGCYSTLKSKISEVYTKHKIVLDVLDENEKQYYNDILFRKANENDFALAIGNLVKWLERCYGEKAILLIDEYDAPINEGFTRGYYDEVIDFIRNMFGAAMKTNSSLKKAILTGVTKIAGKSLFSELNNFRSYNVLSEKYSNYFGFTQEEVIQVLKKCSIEYSSEKNNSVANDLLENNFAGHNFEEIKKWYNGYTFGKTTSIYNPWSIMNVIYGKTEQLVSHWANTASNSILKDHLADKSIEIKESLYALIGGKSLELPITDEVTFNDLVKGTDALWSFLLYAGYLTATTIVNHPGIGNTATYTIPNYEVREEFQHIMNLWLTEKSGGTQTVATMLTAMLTGDEELFTSKLSKFVFNSFSYFDTTNTEPELVYHAFILGLLVHLQNDYYFSSNQVAGYGRSDILIMPLAGNHKTTGIILEFKKTMDKKKLDSVANIALNQIKEKQYITEARKRGAKDIFIYGIGFYKQDISIVMEKV